MAKRRYDRKERRPLPPTVGTEVVAVIAALAACGRQMVTLQVDRNSEGRVIWNVGVDKSWKTYEQAFGSRWDAESWMLIGYSGEDTVRSIEAQNQGERDRAATEAA